MPEYKSAPAFTKAINDRTVDGVFAVHGNVDDGDGWSSRDRSHPGVFGDFKVGPRKRVVFLWQHNSYEPPIATIDQIYEVGKNDLPPSVLLYAPDASGGVGVKRTYLDTPRGNEVLAGIKAGAISEMSYAYEPLRWDYEKTTDESKLPVRNIYEAALYDISDVNWGMNPATSGDGKGQPLAVEATTVRAAVERYIKRLESLYALRVVKEGRRFSSATLQEITSSIDEMKTSIGRLEKLIATDDDEKVSRRQVQDEYQKWQAAQSRLRTIGVI